MKNLRWLKKMRDDKIADLLKKNLRDVKINRIPEMMVRNLESRVMRKITISLPLTHQQQIITMRNLLSIKAAQW